MENGKNIQGIRKGSMENKYMLLEYMIAFPATPVCGIG